MASFVSITEVRDYLTVTNTSGQWSEGLIGSNIRAASNNLQRWSRRQFEAQTATTKTFTTLGREYIVIPDLRTATSVSINDSTLTADVSYHLQPDRLQTGVYVGIEIPSGKNLYRSADAFDRNYDSWMWQGRSHNPNDLVIVGDWGHSTIPDEVLHATKVLASFYTIRPDALLSGARQTPEGNVFDLSRLPLEIQDFIRDWKLEDQVVAL